MKQRFNAETSHKTELKRAKIPVLFFHRKLFRHVPFITVIFFISQQLVNFILVDRSVNFKRSHTLRKKILGQVCEAGKTSIPAFLMQMNFTQNTLRAKEQPSLIIIVIFQQEKSFNYKILENIYSDVIKSGLWLSSIIPCKLCFRNAWVCSFRKIEPQVTLKSKKKLK